MELSTTMYGKPVKKSTPSDWQKTAFYAQMGGKFFVFQTGNYVTKSEPKGLSVNLKITLGLNFGDVQENMRKLSGSRFQA
jgi:hypothetical protein